MSPGNLFYDIEGQPRSWDGSPVSDLSMVYAFCVANGRVMVAWPPHAPNLAEFPGGPLHAGESEEQALRQAVRHITGADMPPAALVSCLRTTLLFYSDSTDAGRYWNLTNLYCAADFSKDALSLNQGTWRGGHGFTLRFVPHHELSSILFNYAHQEAVDFLIRRP